jgi:hypothetical protein
MKKGLFALAVVLISAVGARADEIRLKDGTKIVGTIVDFEQDSFKVQTSYGFALVRKESIAQIIPSSPEKPGEPAKPASPAATPRPSSAPATPAPAVANASTAAAARAEANPAVVRTPAPASSGAPSASSAAAATPEVLPMPAPNPRTAAVAGSSGPVAAAPPQPAAPPAAPSGPVVIRESVEANLYTNQTYAFQFFRPPGWDLIPEARKALPNAITAMGTSDETTLLVVGREPLRGSLDTHYATAERALRDIYENYRPVSVTKRTVAGMPAVEWRFRGVADGKDWSVTALALARGSDVFTLLGMTYADSDLIQIRENVIAKMISSLQFTSAR